MPFFDAAFLKARYDFELQRKEQLTGALNLPVGILGGLGSLLAVMARSFTYTDPLLTWTFVPGLVAATLSFFACLLYLVRAYHRQNYMYLPLLSDIERARVEFLGSAFAIHDEDSAGLEHFESALRERIIEAADRNTRNNDARSAFLYRARVCLFVILGCTAFAGVPYVSDQVRNFYGRSRNAQAIPTHSATGCATSSAISAQSRDS